MQIEMIESIVDGQKGSKTTEIYACVTNIKNKIVSPLDNFKLGKIQK